MQPPKNGFTDRFLASLKCAPKRYDLIDPTRRGLTLRVYPSGTKTFVFRYQRNGQVSRLTIGNYPATTLREAYETHAELTRRLNRGENLEHTPPSELGCMTRASAAVTVGELAEEFLKRYVERERKRPEAARRAIEENILKQWKSRPAESITRRDGVLLLDRIVDRGAPVMANRVAALLAQMFRYGVERGILDASPFVALSRPGGTEKARHRRLEDREIRIFWKKLTRARLSFEVRTALKLILVTAQRPGEVALAAWEEFDLEHRMWTIPEQRSKNGQAHQVPLSDLALTLLKHTRRHFGQTQYLFPTRCWRQKGSVPMTVRALSQGIRDKRDHFGLPPFTPHDLRRTAASLMTAIRVPRLHVEKVLNHTIDDVAEIYDRYDYAEEKRVALERLDEALNTILTRRSAKLIPLLRSKHARAAAG